MTLELVDVAQRSVDSQRGAVFCCFFAFGGVVVAGDVDVAERPVCKVSLTVAAANNSRLGAARDVDAKLRGIDPQADTEGLGDGFAVGPEAIEELSAGGAIEKTQLSDFFRREGGLGEADRIDAGIDALDIDAQSSSPSDGDQADVAGMRHADGKPARSIGQKRFAEWSEIKADVGRRNVGAEGNHPPQRDPADRVLVTTTWRGDLRGAVSFVRRQHGDVVSGNVVVYKASLIEPEHEQVNFVVARRPGHRR